MDEKSESISAKSDDGVHCAFFYGKTLNSSLSVRHVRKKKYPADPSDIGTLV